MGLSYAQLALVGSSLALLIVLAIAVPVLTPLVPPVWAYHGVLAAYWLGFCLPVLVVFVPPARRAALASLALAGLARRIVPAIVVVQVVAVGVGALVPVLGTLSLGALGAATLVALINGTLEEAAWRGAYLETFAQRPVLGFVTSVVLFTLWHVPLALVAGVDFPGGAVMLVGGAAGLGLIWTAIAWRTGRIGWVIIAHVLTNLLAFSALNAHNQWF